MKPEINQKYLIPTDNCFIAPDGEQYPAVFGTVSSISGDELLGIKTNRHSTNWYVTIGNMIVAGCQIHYAIRTDEATKRPGTRDIEHAGRLEHEREGASRIYMADDD